MLKISKAISAGQAKKYYRSELQADRNNSFSASDALSNSLPKSGENLRQTSLESYQGEWRGKLAEKMGLRGAIDAEHFERLCEGLHPLTGEEMTRGAPVKTYFNKHGKEITTMERRAMWDATFSAPKSVSLAATVGGDERIREAHRQSVYRAVNEIEKYVEARLGGNIPSERTEKMISALFEHDTARPDKIFKFAAPQLHTHVGIFNATEIADGRIKPIQPLEIYKTQKYATAVYRIELADKLQKLGYEIEIDARTKAPEIKGFSSEYLKESSPRSQEIQNEAEAFKKQLGQSGLKIENDAGIRQIAAWQRRESKGFDAEEMKTRALELEVKYDFQAQRIAGEAMRKSSIEYDMGAARMNAGQAVDFAKEIAFQKAGFEGSLETLAQSSPDSAVSLSNNFASKFNERQFLTEALEKGVGNTTFDAVREEYAARRTAGEFANIIRNDFEKSSSGNMTRETAKEFAKEITNEASNGISGEPRQTAKTSENIENIEKTGKEIKAENKIEDLSMNDLENAVREKMVVEQEVSQAAEWILAI